jgi:catechol 2,3-dioxygenase-like lactoylglutathione lyase family enzyme
MLKNSSLIAFIPTRDPQKSREFYGQTLGLRFISEDSFAIVFVFDANGTMLRIANVSNVPDFKPFPFTILGWEVPSAEESVRELTKNGLKFERFPAMDQNELGIWNSPAGAKITWFKDPDGNTLSITEF